MEFQISDFVPKTFRAPNISAPIDHIIEAKRADNERQAINAGRFDAEEIFRHLMHRVSEFEGSLEDDEELGLQLANFGVAATIHIRNIRFKNPNLIEFSGIDIDGNNTMLVQHISQLNFMLSALKPVAEEKPFRMGF
jgi:hypothetical protein